MSGTQQLLLGEVSGGPATYIEDVFSTYLYNGASNTALQIQNGIDLSTKGGMVWIKCRSNAVNHELFDTSRGVSSSIQSNSTNAAAATPRLGTFNTDGFTHSATPTNQNLDINETSRTFASWTFRKQPKFFDIVTWSGDGVAGRQITHNLGSTPGCIIVKATNNTNAWTIWHRSVNSGSAYFEFSTAAADTSTAAVANRFGNGTSYVAPTSTYFTVGANGGTNGSSITYVAYIFAHDAGGFGLTGTDNVISCGSYTGNGTTQSISLGYEPQWIMIKRTDAANSWVMMDNMRGMGQSYNNALVAESSAAEAGSTTVTDRFGLTSTGFSLGPTGSSALNLSGGTYIYIAIRRGPMKVPTDATKVFAESTRGTTAPAWTSGFPVDWFFQRTTGADNWAVLSRLTGSGQLRFNTVDAETTATEFKFDWMNGVNGSLYSAPTDYGWMMKRAPSFFDEVCYTGTGVNRTITHNLGVAPELMIVKNRTNVAGYGWPVYSAAIPNTNYLFLNDTRASTSGTTIWNSTSPTSSVFSVGTNAVVNQSGDGYVAYLFATCAGVSKVGSYTGTGTLTTINCGFTGGARFVLIKRTDTTSDWFLWDTFRGMVAGTDPALLMNATTASANANSVYTIATGFQLLASPSKDVNTNGGTYIYLAIA